MGYDTIRFTDGVLEILDQTCLPAKENYIKCRAVSDVFDAIVKMKIRGAPAIGIAGAFGAYLGASSSKAKYASEVMIDVKKASAYLASSRPTARNLFWALERMEAICADACRSNVSKTEVAERMLSGALGLLEQDKSICRKIGKNGSVLIKKGARVLTHCNAGALATGDFGTALGIIFHSAEKIKMVYVDETRPLFQGSRLTAWELSARNIPATLICDNAAASLMGRGLIDAVIVGADRVTANGDTANKIGTYGLAVAAKYHKVPFYVASPVSTFDLSLSDGSMIPIEERHPDEVRKVNGKLITLEGMPVLNPAFDVTPRRLISSIITERGIIERPGKENIRRALS